MNKLSADNVSKHVSYFFRYTWAESLTILPVYTLKSQVKFHVCFFISSIIESLIEEQRNQTIVMLRTGISVENVSKMFACSR